MRAVRRTPVLETRFPGEPAEERIPPSCRHSNVSLSLRSRLVAQTGAAVVRPQTVLAVPHTHCASPAKRGSAQNRDSGRPVFPQICRHLISVNARPQRTATAWHEFHKARAAGTRTKPRSGPCARTADGALRCASVSTAKAIPHHRVLRLLKPPQTSRHVRQTKTNNKKEKDREKPKRGTLRCTQNATLRRRCSQ